MKEPVRAITRCRICRYIGASEAPLVPMVDLGTTPLADSFVSDVLRPEASYPLRVAVCPTCKLVQLIDEVRPDLLFNDDYGFFTGASPSSIAYFKDYAASLMRDYAVDTQGLIIEIASNDGTLLRHFVNADRDVLGVDPAANTVDVANRNGVRSIAEHFSLNTGMKIYREYGTASLVIANNVLAHIDTLHDFMAGVTAVLSDGGLFVAEVQYLPHLLFNNAFDHIYHEHRSFFSLAPLRTLYELHGLTIIDVVEADTQGGSIRVYARRRDVAGAPSASVDRLLALERELGLDDLATYQGFQARVDYTRHKLVGMLRDLKAAGKTIYGFGASAKGNTLLNYCGIDTSLLDCIVDLTPYKIGKLSPGQHIPVKHPDEVVPPDYYLLLVWNYLPGVLKRNKSYLASGGHFIVPIPTPFIV